MHEARQAKITSPITTLKDDYVRMIPICFIVGVIGFAISIATVGMNFSRFSYSYLTSFCFILTICLGCLFFVIVYHLTRAGWAVTVRRIAELYAACLFPLLILFLPILIPVVLGMNTVYEWNQPGWSVHGSEAEKQLVVDESPNPIPIEKLKRAYLNPLFFGVRTLFYFIVWGAMSWFLLRTSLAQDKTGDAEFDDPHAESQRSDDDLVRGHAGGGRV